MCEEIRKIQLIQLEAMKKLHQVCVENDIKYILMGGSLLGAIRHRGFIPWDDDFDIALIRPEYEKLLKILQEKPIDGWFLQTFYTDKHYVQPYAKLRKNGTKFVESYFAEIKMHDGIFLDIFPYDKVPSPNSRTARFRRLLARFLTFAIWRREGCNIKRDGIKKIETIISSCINLLFSKNMVVSLQHSLVYRENKSWKYVASMFSSNYSISQTYMKKSDFLDVILTDFENSQFYVPKKWDEMLKRMYKNYMEWPPEEKRNSGHTIQKIEFSEKE